MGLLDRAMHTQAPTIPNHQFQALCLEWSDPQSPVTRADVIAAFDISAAEEPELDWLAARYLAAATNNKADRFSQIVHNVFMLAEQGIYYTDKTTIQNRLEAASGP